MANSAQVRSRSRHWVSQVPSGKGMCTASSSVRYSRPYSASGSSRFRQIGLSMKIAWAVEQESCRWPGSASS